MLRLARLGFADAGQAGTLLGPKPDGLDLWTAGGPADAGAAAVVSALGRAADPDLALLALSRIAEPDLLAALRADPVLRRRLVAVLGASAALGDHLAAYPADWRLLTRRARAARPAARAVGADPADPPTGTGGTPARGGGEDVVTDLRARRTGGTCSCWPPATWPARSASTRSARRWPSSPTARCRPVSRSRWPGCGRGAGAARLAVIAMGKSGGRELNYVSDVDVVFVAEPADGADVDDARAATQLASAADAGLPRRGLAGRRRPAARGQGRPAGAHPGQPRGVLRALGADLGVPGAAQGAAGRRRPRPRAGATSTRSRRWSGRPPSARLRRRRAGDAPPGRSSTRCRRTAAREIKLGAGRPARRRVRRPAAAARPRPGRRVAAGRRRRSRALAALPRGGYVGRDDAASLHRRLPLPAAVEHRLQLQRLRRTHLVPDDAAGRALARPRHGLPAGRRGDAVAVFDAEWALHAPRGPPAAREAVLPAAAATRSPGCRATQLRLTPEAGGARLEALGFADPDGALRHIEALTAGVSRRRGDPADAAAGDAATSSPTPRTRTPACSATGRCPTRSADSPWYLRLPARRGPGRRAAGARCSAPAGYVADLLDRAPEALRMLGDDAELRAAAGRRRCGRCCRAAAGAARRAGRGGRRRPGLRRQELLRIAFADLLGPARPSPRSARRSPTSTDGHAGGRTATRPPGRSQRDAGRPLPTRIAVIAMGRLGGARDRLRLRRRRAVRATTRCPARPSEDAAAAANAVAAELRRLLALPAPRPAAASSTPTCGRRGAAARWSARSAPTQAYYARWSSAWEAQALLRAAPLAGDAELGERFVDADRPGAVPGRRG